MPNRQAREPREPREKIDPASIAAVYEKYAAVSKKLGEASSNLRQAVDMILALDKAVRNCDPSGRLMIQHKLRIKLVLGAVFPVRQHLDRLIIRMELCASSRDSVIADAERPEPAFE